MPSGNEPGAAGEQALYGIWRARIGTPLGWLNVELILKPDKHFSQLSAMNGLLAYDEGEITVLEQFIHFVVTDHEPKKYNGQDLHWLKNFGYFYTFVDKNTVEFVDDVSKERWVARRG